MHLFVYTIKFTNILVYLDKAFFFFLVYADGSICLDILQNRWSPTYDVAAILTSIQVNIKFMYISSHILVYSLS